MTITETPTKTTNYAMIRHLERFADCLEHKPLKKLICIFKVMSIESVDVVLEILFDKTGYLSKLNVELVYILLLQDVFY
jgi:hypothetical protein